MKPTIAGCATFVWLSVAWLCGSGAASGADAVGDLIAEGRVRSRQMRYGEAETLLRRALTLGGTQDQKAFAEMMLGVVAHQQRSLASAETHYRTALEQAGSAAIRTTAQENLDLLTADRTRFDAYRRVGERLDRWLWAEAAAILVVGAVFFRMSRRSASTL